MDGNRVKLPGSSRTTFALTALAMLGLSTMALGTLVSGSATLIRLGLPSFFFLTLGYLALGAPSIRWRLAGMVVTLAISFWVFQALVSITTPMFDIALR